MRLADQFKEQERPKDRDNQKGVLQRLCAFKGGSWSFETTATGSVFDALVSNAGAPIAIVEVKCRTCTFDAFANEGYRIDRHKIDSLIAVGKRKGLDSVLAIRWKCGTHGYVNLTKLTPVQVGSFPCKYVKRGDRDELPDLQVDIPMNLFVKF